MPSIVHGPHFWLPTKQMDESESQETIRVGSPFAVDPAPVAPIVPSTTMSVEAIYDVGPLRYTALGAVTASVLVMGFAIGATIWFPAGGTLVASLGCLLSILGLYSPIPLRSAGCLVIHAALFILCYLQSIAS